jgi:hypothetical protein
MQLKWRLRQQTRYFCKDEAGKSSRNFRLNGTRLSGNEGRMLIMIARSVLLFVFGIYFEARKIAHFGMARNSRGCRSSVSKPPS